jgi:excisionase family DNA binding protein
MTKHHTPSPFPALIGIAQAMELTGLSDKTIRRRIADGTLRAHRVGPRNIRIEVDSVINLLTPMGVA